MDAFDNDTKVYLDYLFQNQSNFLPVPNYAKLAKINSASGSQITIAQSNNWFVANHYAVIIQGGFIHLSRISSVVGLNINLLKAPSFTVIPSIAYIMPCIIAEPIDNDDINFLTASLFESNIEFRSVRGLESVIQPSSPTLFDGRDIFNYAVDWKKSPMLTYKSTIEKNSSDNGVAIYRNMIGYPNLVLGQQITTFSQIEAFNLELLFRRLKGRKGELYASLMNDDMQIKAIGTNTVTVSGLNLYNVYRNSKIHKSICVKTKTGIVYYNKIASISFSGLDSVINVATNWFGAFNVSDIDVCSWLYLCRMASDDITFQWTTSEICDININLQVLENLAAES